MRPRGRSSARAALALGALAAVLAGLLPATAAAAPAPDRFSLVHGCYGLRALGNGAHVAEQGGTYTATRPSTGVRQRFRMQATGLGRYLLYDQDRRFFAIDVLGRVAPADRPSGKADWTVLPRGRGFELVNRQVGKELAVSRTGRLVMSENGNAFAFEGRTDCPRYPEIGVGVVGKPAKGRNPDGTVSGLVDAHMHHMAFEFLGGRAHCGRPWHRFGAPHALLDCPDHQPNGAGAVLENTVSYGNPAGTHDTDGWSSFEGWPHHASLTHEQSYYKWLERSWRGGLRIFVNLLVENEVLCEIYPLKKNSCDEMVSARLQAKRMRELQSYIDAQRGGPGKGWYRIVRSPGEARRVIEQGKLAVVMGMETSKPFGCGRFNGRPTCDEGDIDREIDAFHRLGVRQLEIVNKFDNAFTGVAGDDGSTGTITNTGNFYDTGRFWDFETCDPPHHHDRQPTAVHYHNDDMLIANGLARLRPLNPGLLPVYTDRPPWCNKLRLSSLGRHALRRAMARGMIFDPDHMGVYARRDALDFISKRRYPGVISSHSWSTKDALPRIYRLGGFITPYAGDAESFVQKWRETRRFRDPRRFFGFGYGADMNGFGSQGGPRGGPNPVTYPFRSFDGKVTIRQQRSGTRTYNVNRDGVAHYGLYPDWIEDIRKVAGPNGPTLMREMGRGAEAYLRTWERATSASR